MNYNNDLPGGKQATKGDKKKTTTVIYYMDYFPLSKITYIFSCPLAVSVEWSMRYHRMK